MVEKASKPRKKKAAQIEVTHRVYGLGNVVERRPTANGADVLEVRFPDKTVRTLLAAERYWIDLNLASIPISEPRKTKDVAQKKQKVVPDAIEEPAVEAVAVAAD